MSRAPRNRPPSRRVPWPVILLLALAIVGVYVYITWRQRNASAGSDLEQTADLISDDRLIYGGAPRAMPGAGEEVQFTVLKNQAYIVGYSESRRDPLWAAYRVFHTEVTHNDPRPSGFSTDLRTVSHVRETDYTRSGYERGHMAPNSAIMHDYGAPAQLETFLLSNICPQSPALNEKVWEKLEVDERKYADKMEEVWVIDGPIFGDLNGGQTVRLASGIAVPIGFYKIVIDEEGHAGGRPRVFSVIMPQTVKGTELPQEFLTTVSEIQKETRLDFLWKLDAATQGELENTRWKMW